MLWFQGVSAAGFATDLKLVAALSFSYATCGLERYSFRLMAETVFQAVCDYGLVYRTECESSNG